MTKVIDCVAIGEELMKEIIRETEALKAKGITPGIATLLVGDDFGANMYRGQVEKFCEEAGFNYVNENPAADVSEAAVIEIVKKLNADPKVSGILPLRPFPAQISDSAVNVRVYSTSTQLSALRSLVPGSRRNVSVLSPWDSREAGK